MAFDPIKEARKFPGLPLLRYGSRGWIVKLLRRILVEHSFLLPEEEVSDYFDGALAEAVEAFQKSRVLEVDGLVGVMTWAELKLEPRNPYLNGWSRGKARDADKRERIRSSIVGIAEFILRLNVREKGKNRGPIVEDFIKHNGGRLGDPWCIDFIAFVVDWAFAEFGDRPPFEIGRSSSRLVRVAKKNNSILQQTELALPGDLFILAGGSTGYKHGTIVVSLNDGGFLGTIEGNTNIKGSSEGDGVYRRERKPGTGVAIDLLK